MYSRCRLRKMASKNKTKENKKLPGFKEVFSHYWPEVKQHPFWLTGVIVGTLALQVTGLLSPWFLRNFFNVLAVSTPSTQEARILFGILVLVALTWAADWLMYQLQRISSEHLGSKVMERLYISGFKNVMEHSYGFFTSNFTGSLVHKISSYARAFENLFDVIITQFVPTFIYITGAVVILYFHNHILGLMLGVWAVFFVVFQIYVSRLRRPARAELSKLNTKVSGDLSDSISNQQTVSLFSAVHFESGNFAKSVGDWGRAQLRVWTVDGWTQASYGLLMTIIQVALLYGAIVYWSRGELTVGDFYLIQAYLLTTFNRLVGIGRSLRGLYRSISDAGEMLEVLNMPREIADKRGAKHLAVDAGEVWFDDVSFNFHKGTPILHQFNLTIAGGERVALVGPSGAGKSTVTKLLLRLYDVDKGEIKIDKQDISKVTQDSLRDAIAFVPQEPILFHRTLMENIRYGWRDATDEQVIEAAKKAHCHEFISRLPLGYETFVGERGIKLSGGERQRVAIARAILKDAPILVLDEATSSLDSESEALIQDALNILMEGKTVIVIAHRLSTIMKMDRIIVMEKGNVVAQGTHLQLINERGLYQKLWSIQAGGFIGGAEDSTSDEEVLDVEDDDPEEEMK